MTVLDVQSPTVASSSALLAVVLRPFDGAGARRLAGEVVDVAEWRLHDGLVDTRMIRLLDLNDPKPLTADDGRMFLDDESFLTYIASREAAAADAVIAEEN